MNNEIQALINEAVLNILKNSSSEKKLKNLIDKHDVKIHFVPRNYRIFGGILQSMNIQFGNFLEAFMTLLIKSDGRYTILEDYSGKKSNSFQLSTQNDTRIDNFISSCQYNDINIDEEFPKLLQAIANDDDPNLSSIKHDIDILFQNKQTGDIYFLEVKYNDDHDTGKFVDINRKFIKTYAYLVREFPKNKIKPILFFFNNKKMKGNIYIPELTNIRRGKAFFEEFLRIKYEDVDSYMRNLSESPENIKAFDDLYKKIMSIRH
ncbi:MAG: restriction endonuclease [[Pasteurella] mairii]|uniref:type II site-specific deoxyribonuclease n=1 Tax=[Pasteurella] mairii TaxID=757 RepID=A0A379B2C7_9PAST|nr:restriction endonuclease [[Pasteurella] mairii]SUB32651.1 Uncharacterised protein [[Pasteurella] mairii]